MIRHWQPGDPDVYLSFIYYDLDTVGAHQTLAAHWIARCFDMAIYYIRSNETVMGIMKV